jgi:hypothetical protein
MHGEADAGLFSLRARAAKGGHRPSAGTKESRDRLGLGQARRIAVAARAGCGRRDFCLCTHVRAVVGIWGAGPGALGVGTVLGRVAMAMISRRPSFPEDQIGVGEPRGPRKVPPGGWRKIRAAALVEGEEDWTRSALD